MKLFCIEDKSDVYPSTMSRSTNIHNVYPSTMSIHKISTMSIHSKHNCSLVRNTFQIKEEHKYEKKYNKLEVYGPYGPDF